MIYETLSPSWNQGTMNFDISTAPVNCPPLVCVCCAGSSRRGMLFHEFPISTETAQLSSHSGSSSGGACLSYTVSATTYLIGSEVSVCCAGSPTSGKCIWIVLSRQTL